MRRMIDDYTGTTMDKKLADRVVTHPGYRKINWMQAASGQEVYLEGTRDGEKWAYGPFTIKDKDKRILINPNGQLYKGSGSTLLVKER